MKKEQFIRILHKYVAGTANEEESKLIETYYSLLLKKSKIESGDIIKRNNTGALKEELLNEVWHQVKEREKRIKTFRLPPVLWKAAAVFIVLVASGIIFYTYHVKRNNEKMALISTEQRNETTGIKPGGNAAVLTLSNGKKVLLTSVANGALTQQGNIKVIKLNNGQLTYKGAPSGSSGEKQPVYNTLSTPRGGQYKVVLSDGTKIWLNSASSLEYPVAFSEATRTVKIDGEGYFEIAPDAEKPFIVEVGKLKVTVLGTTFDVNSYEDNNIRTTLVSGAVNVKDGENSVLLKPGEAAGLDNGKIKVSAANVAVITAWKDGLFYFDNTNIKEIMEEVARWYNVKIVYETTELGHKVYSGKLPRYSEVNTVLKMLEMTGTVHFEIKDRTITVMN